MRVTVTVAGGSRRDIGIVELGNSQMLSPVEICSDTISEIFYSVAVTGRITESDYKRIIAAILNNSLDEEEIKSVKRMVYFLKRGKIVVVNKRDDNIEISDSIDYTAEFLLPILQAA